MWHKDLPYESFSSLASFYATPLCSKKAISLTWLVHTVSSFQAFASAVPLPEMFSPSCLLCPLLAQLIPTHCWNLAQPSPTTENLPWPLLSLDLDRYPNLWHKLCINRINLWCIVYLSVCVLWEGGSVLFHLYSLPLSIWLLYLKHSVDYVCPKWRN